MSPSRADLEASVQATASSIDGRRFVFQRSAHDLDIEVGGLRRHRRRLSGPGLRARVRVDRGRRAHGGASGLERDGRPDRRGSWKRRRARRAVDAVPRRADHAGDDERRRATSGPAQAERRRARRRRDASRRGVARLAGRERVRQAHLLLRPVRVGQDVRPRHRPRAPDPRHGPANRRARPQLRLRPAGRGPGGRGLGRRGQVPRSGGGARRSPKTAAAGSDRLHVRFTDCDAEEQAAVLRLDPIADREEYGALVDLLDSGIESAPTSVGDLASRLLDAPDPATRALGARIRNLGLHRWPIWSGGDIGSVQDLVQPGGPRVAIVDLGSLQTPGEKAIAAESVLAALWRRRSVAGADPDRHRRGAQRLSTRARRSGDRPRERATRRGSRRRGGSSASTCSCRRNDPSA